MNISELAAHLNVSPTTVSRVLSGSAEKYRISAVTVARVREAATRFQVAPDLLGSSLRSGKLGMIGLLVPDITNPFFSGLARSIELQLRDHDLTVQLCDSSEDSETELALLKQMLGRRLDGLLVAPVGRYSDEMAQLMDRASMPLLMVDRVLPEIGVPSVSLDNLKAGRLAAAHLIEHGFDKVGCLRGDRNSYTDQERFRGVVDELEKNGFSLNPEFVCGDGYDYESSLAEAQKLLCGRDLPDAVIALGGQGILSILETSKANLIGIPDDLSVVAFDEQPWSSFVSPPLTTISQPTEEMAKVAAESLLSLLGIRNESAESILLSASLISRHSVQSRGARK